MIFDNNFCWPYDGIDLVLSWIFLEMLLILCYVNHVDSRMLVIKYLSGNNLDAIC